jgi:hypothetical protein
LGGRGSGWQRSSAPVVERCEKIDLADLKQHSADFAEGEAVALGSVLVSLRYPGLRLRYWAKDAGYLDEVVPFVYTPTQFGGRRQWLSCLRCSRRVRVLYGGKRNLFRCRKCYGLVYRSTRQTLCDRVDSQANKLALKICGGDRDLYDGDEFPGKPKRMRWATYRRLEERFYDFKDQWELGVEQKIMGFLRRAL